MKPTQRPPWYRHKNAPIAVHEAGHVIAHCCLTREFAAVGCATIDPTVIGDEDASGFTRHQITGVELDDGQRVAMAAVSMAGPVAEMVFFGDSDGMSADLADAQTDMRRVAPGESEIERDRFIASLVWDLETLIRARKREVAAVARALIERGTVYNSELDELLAGASDADLPPMTPKPAPWRRTGKHKRKRKR